VDRLSDLKGTDSRSNDGRIALALMTAEPQLSIEDGRGGSGARSDRSLRYSWSSPKVLLPSDNGLVFSSRCYTALVRSYGPEVRGHHTAALSRRARMSD